MVGSRRAHFRFARPDQSSPPRPPVSTSGWVCVYGGEKGTTPAKSGISGLLRTSQSIEGYVYMAVKKGPPPLAAGKPRPVYDAETCAVLGCKLQLSGNEKVKK